MIGRCRKMEELFQQIALVAPSPVAVLVHGETGTGKEPVARELHRLSGRAGEFIAVNCAQIAAGLADSEFFGHVKGAFTGADANRPGAFVEAHGGTLFLDEVGELGLDAQAKLLRALQTGQFRTVGGKGQRQVDVRVLSATHRDLKAMVKQGGFREDLYFRLAQVVLRVPPLRDRGDDILLLAEHFIRRYPGKGASLTLADATRQALLKHKWRGNVRELESAIVRACIFVKGTEIQPEDVLPDGANSAISGATICLRGKTLDEIKRDAFQFAIKEYGTIRGAADGLQIPKSTLHKDARQLGVQLGDDPRGRRTKKDGE